MNDCKLSEKTSHLGRPQKSRYLIPLSKMTEDRYIEPIDAPGAITLPEIWQINSPVYQHLKSGWHTPNMNVIADCVPVFTNPDALHLEKDIGLLEDALNQSIIYLQFRIDEAMGLQQAMKRDLERLSITKTS